MNLIIANLYFGVCLYGGSELSKHLSKCLLRMRKMQKIKPDQNFFMIMKIRIGNFLKGIVHPKIKMMSLFTLFSKPACCHFCDLSTNANSDFFAIIFVSC